MTKKKGQWGGGGGNSILQQQQKFQKWTIFKEITGPDWPQIGPSPGPETVFLGWPDL